MYTMSLVHCIMSDIPCLTSSIQFSASMSKGVVIDHSTDLVMSSKRFAFSPDILHVIAPETVKVRWISRH